MAIRRAAKPLGVSIVSASGWAGRSSAAIAALWLFTEADSKRDRETGQDREVSKEPAERPGPCGGEDEGRDRQQGHEQQHPDHFRQLTPGVTPLPR